MGSVIRHSPLMQDPKPTQMKDKTLATLLVIGTVVMTFLLAVMYHQDKTLQEYRDIIENIDTTTVTKTDTVYQTKTYTDTIPKYITRTITKRDTLYQQNDSTPHIVELKHKTFYNTVTEDKDTISYQAHLSGYDMDSTGYPRLDSINLSLRHYITQTNTTTTQVIKVPQKRPKWHLSPSVGLGYGVVNKQWDAFIGVSLGYDILGK